MHIEQSVLWEAQNLKHFSASTDHFFIPLIFDLFICLNDGLSNGIKIYPNPTLGNFTIEGAAGMVTIYDIYGRLVLTANTNTLDISNAADGIYFVRIVNEQGKVFVGKIVKE